MAVKKQTGGQGKNTTKAPSKKKSPPRKKAAPKKPAKRPAAKKKAAKKPAGKKRTGKTNLAYELKKVGLGIAILLAICLTVAMLADIFIKSGRPVTDKPPSEVAAMPDVTAL